MPITSIDPANDHFDDLATVGRAIGNARIVMLGEAGHGDGATFLAKGRLVRFLHERMGFDVLAWESGTWACEQMDAAIGGNAPIADVARVGVYDLWATSQEVLPVFTYARASRSQAHPLHMAGIDPKFSTTVRPVYRTWLFDRMDATHALTAEDRSAVERAFERFPNAGKMQKLSPEERNVDRVAFARLVTIVSGDPKTLAIALPELVLLRRSLHDVLALYDWHEAVHADVSTEIAWNDNVSLNNVRDRAMAENLAWLARERFPNSKIIVWGASMHFARNVGDIDAGRTTYKRGMYEGFRPMGDVAEEFFSKEIYRVAFTSVDGETGVTGAPPSKISDVPEPGSVEAFLGASTAPYAFADLRSPASELRGRRPGAFLGHVPFITDWSQVFDGAFFIRTMSASTPRN